MTTQHPSEATPDPDRGEVLSILGTLAALTEMAELSKPAEVEQ